MPRSKDVAKYEFEWWGVLEELMNGRQVKLTCTLREATNLRNRFHSFLAALGATAAKTHPHASEEVAALVEKYKPIYGQATTQMADDGLLFLPRSQTRTGALLREAIRHSTPGGFEDADAMAEAAEARALARLTQERAANAPLEVSDAALAALKKYGGRSYD